MIGGGPGGAGGDGAGGTRGVLTVGELRQHLAQFDDDDEVRIADAVPASENGRQDRLAGIERRLGALEWDVEQRLSALERRLGRDRDDDDHDT